MYYKILKVDKQKARQPFTISSAASSVGKFIRQAGPPGRFAVVELHIEPTALSKNSEPKVEVVWDVAPTKFPDEIANIIFDGVVRGVSNYLEPNDWRDGAMTSVLITVKDAEWHPVDSSEFCYTVATALAIKDCFSKSGFTNVKV